MVASHRTQNGSVGEGLARVESDRPQPVVTVTRSGLRIRLPVTGDFADALASLERAVRDGLAVRGLAVTIDAGGRTLGVSQLREIEVLLLERHGAALLQVVEGQREAGAATPRRPSRHRAESAVAPVPVVEGADPVAPPPDRPARRSLRRVQQERTEPAEPTAPAQPPPAAPAPPPPAVPAGPGASVPAGGRTALAGAPAGLPVDAQPTLLVRRTLRSGQRVRFHGNVVVLGDVNPGAEIVAAGDIVVMGTLRGVAHAGATGSAEAVVAAFRLQPTQLRLGAVIGRAPDGHAPRPDVPEVARLRDGALVIERYLPAGAE